MSDFRIIVTGGRKRESSLDYTRLDNAIWVLDHTGSLTGLPVIIQGGCPDGADLLARKLAKEWEFAVETVPADFDKHPDDAVEVSNQAMADAGAHLCLAFPSAGRSTGTWDMIRRACAAGIETRIYPEGSHDVA